MGEIRRLEIYSPKILKEKKALIISDLHREKKTGQKNLDKVKVKTQDDFPEIDFIFIVGDLLNDVNDLRDPEFRKIFIESLKDFTRGKLTFVSFGNHDKMTREGPNAWNDADERLIKEALSEIENIIVVDNNVQRIGEIKIGSFSPDSQYYLKKGESKAEYARQFYRQFNPNMFDSTTYNIFMTHEPQSIISISEEENAIIQPHTNLVLSGHMHDGLLPTFVQRLLNKGFIPKIIRKIIKNMGLLSPQMRLLPKYAHGEHTIEETDFIINSPINTRVECPLLNELYGANATVLTMKPSQSHQNIKRK